MTADNPRLRLGIVGIVAVSLFAALFARLWYLQVLAAPEYKLAAERNQVRVVTEPAPRGRILDRNGRVLVDNRPSNVVAVDRSQLQPDEVEPLLERLAPVLGLPAVMLARRLDDPRVSPYTPVPVAEDVSLEVMTQLRERQDDFPAVVAKRVAVRHYPHGSLAAHVLGYVGEINDTELTERRDEYELGDQIGKAGVERAYESDLRGVDGEVRVEVDAEGVPIRVLERRPPVQGDDVVLSLDLEVQREVESALADGLAAARGRLFADDDRPLVADAGSVVALDAKEGTVIAMASYPTFDPSQLVNGITTAEAEALFGESTGAPFTNRAVQGGYAPGSTWKLVTAHAALSTGLVAANTTVVDQGSFTVPRCTGKCNFRNAGGVSHGAVDVRRALSVSSDVYFYTQGYQFWTQRDRFGDTAIQDAAGTLGFGAPTGVPLPAEAGGRIPTPASRAALHEEKPDLFPEGRWFVGDNVNLAIGQGELVVTPVQLANAYAIYASGGTRWAPNVALRVVDADGEVLREIAPRVAAHVDIPAEVRDPIMTGLVSATRDGFGTAAAAFAGWPHDQYPVAGKTGTAQASPKQDTALFAAIAPANDPRYVVTVVMEQAGFGSTSAAPVARRVFGALSGLEAPEPVELVAGGSG